MNTFLYRSKTAADNYWTGVLALQIVNIIHNHIINPPQLHNVIDAFV